MSTLHFSSRFSLTLLVVRHVPIINVVFLHHSMVTFLPSVVVLQILSWFPSQVPLLVVRDSLSVTPVGNQSHWGQAIRFLQKGLEERRLMFSAC